MGITVPGYVGAVGYIDTGHKFPVKNTEKNMRRKMTLHWITSSQEDI